MEVEISVDAVPLKEKKGKRGNKKEVEEKREKKKMGKKKEGRERWNDCKLSVVVFCCCWYE